MPHNATLPDRPRVAVVGGGLAGMAAALELCEAGARVELFERRRRLGGRAASMRDAATGRTIDLCPHAAMGCCTALADFLDRLGADDCFRPNPTLHFFDPGGRRYDLRAAGLLPAPLHLLPALWRLKYLSVGERWGIVRAMRRLGRTTPGDPADSADDAATIGPWLRAQGQSPRAVELFWSPILVSALSETLDRASLPAARKVFRDGFLASRDAHQLRLPTMPLGAIFDERAGARLSEQGVTIHRGTRVARIEGAAGRAEALVLSDGTRRRFDAFALAAAWGQAGRLLDEPLRAALDGAAAWEAIPAAPITAVHLWFDRPITPLPHAVLPGRMSQWLFRPQWASRTSPDGYCQVVISASHALVGRPSGEVVEAVRRELAEVFLDARQAKLLHARVVTHRQAVFSLRPGVERLRPAQRTPVGNLALAGDWTATGWPATMEGAVRSGFLAARVLLADKSPSPPGNSNAEVEG
jgi:squalene-associated FAD-dependent desaturase